MRDPDVLWIRNDNVESNVEGYLEIRDLTKETSVRRTAHGDRAPSEPSARRATLPTRRLHERDRKRIRAGGGAPPDAARRCTTIDTVRSLAYFCR